MPICGHIRRALPCLLGDQAHDVARLGSRGPQYNGGMNPKRITPAPNVPPGALPDRDLLLATFALVSALAERLTGQRPHVLTHDLYGSQVWVAAATSLAVSWEGPVEATPPATPSAAPSTAGAPVPGPGATPQAPVELLGP
jgi:hypothetical protein